MFEKRSSVFLVLLVFISLFSVTGFAQNDSVSESPPDESGDDFDDDLEEEDGFDDRGDDLEDDFDEESGEDFDDEFDDEGEDDFDEEEDDKIIDEIGEEYGDAELDVGAGITPDNKILYNVDKFLGEIFSSEIDRMKERMAEVKKMIEEGNVEDARIALVLLKREAEDLEEDVDPEQRDEVREAVAQIKNALDDIKDEIPDEDKEEFVDDVIDGQKSLARVVQIREKMKELCEELSKLDLEEFRRVCKPNEDSSRWEQGLYDDLSEEQKEEAKKFVKVISACFKDPADCDCEASTNVESFVRQCKAIVKAEVECDNGDESACEVADEISEDIFDTLEDAPYLQDALREIERRFSDVEDERFDRNIPFECREEGITGRERDAREKCMRIMIEKSEETPDECRPALKEALDRGVDSEREFRKICEEIMFEQNAPKECTEAGIKDHKSCGKFMFEQNAPKECTDAGFTGESPRDGNRCRDLMDKIGEEGGFDRRGPNRGPGHGSDCRDISNSQERLACFDRALQGAREGDFGGREFRGKSFDERYKETKDREMQCAEGCDGAWDFSEGQCRCRKEEGGRYERRRDFEDHRGPPQGWQNGPPPGWQPPEEWQGQGPPPEWQPPQQGQQPPEGWQQPPQGEFQQGPPPEFSGSPPESSGTTTTGEESGGSSGESGSSGTTGEGGTTTTGGVVWGRGGITGNAFIDYYYDW